MRHGSSGGVIGGVGNGGGENNSYSGNLCINNLYVN